MKIPETSANVGAYYGNDENGQWQSSQYVVMSPANGVMIDGGVGGGVVGSGDAGANRPMYPVHIPRHHMPGYVMTGGYYSGPYPPQGPNADDFADYMWMENEEEFDKQVMQQLEEEALMEQCIEAMLEDEQRERLRPQANGHSRPTTSNGASCSLSLEEAVSRSTLNPLAAEFVPIRVRPPTEDKPESPPEPIPQPPPTEPAQTHDIPESDTRQQAALPQHTTPEELPQNPPEVSAADLDSDVERKPKRVDAKKPKAKPQPVKEVKSDSKLVKKETLDIKVTKSETDVTDDAAVFAVEAKPAPAPTPAPEEPSGPKPINYAAAAKANKKKPTTPPATDKTTPQPTMKVDKKPMDKRPVKTDKVPRKNSAK